MPCARKGGEMDSTCEVMVVCSKGDYGGGTQFGRPMSPKVGTGGKGQGIFKESLESG